MAEVARDKDEGACTVVEGGGRKSLLSDPGSELHLGRGKGTRKKLRRQTWDVQNKNKRQYFSEYQRRSVFSSKHLI